LKSKYIIIASIIYLVIFFAFASGLVNSIIEGPAAKALVVPSRSIQSIGETIVTVMILFMGLIGAYLLYESGKAQSAKKQWVFLIAGFATIFCSERTAAGRAGQKPIREKSNAGKYIR
jgi:hypothetical protein